MKRTMAESGKMQFITDRASGTYICHCASNERGPPGPKTLFANLLTGSTGLNPRPFHAGVLVGKVTQAFPLHFCVLPLSFHQCLMYSSVIDAT